MTGERCKARAVVCARCSWMSPVRIQPAAAIAMNMSATYVGIVPRMHEGQRSLYVRWLPSFVRAWAISGTGRIERGVSGLRCAKSLRDLTEENILLVYEDHRNKASTRAASQA